MKLFRSGFAVLAILTAMAASTPAVRADLYGTTYFSKGFDVTMKGNITVSTQVGTFTTYLASNSLGTNATPYITYCVDLKHSTNAGKYVALDKTPTQLPLTDTFVSGASNLYQNTAWFQAGMGRAAWLVNTFGSSLKTNAERGLLQVAVWKVLYSNHDDYAHFGDITKGSEYTTSLTSAQAAIVNGYLAASLKAGGGTTYAMAKALWVNFSSVKGDHVQFQVIGVPEPSSLAIAGLGSIGLVALMRRRGRSA